MTQIQGTVGWTSNLDGTNPSLYMGKQNDVLVSEVHGKFYHPAYRGTLFRTFIPALTILSTHASPLAAGTGTPIIGIWNPPASTKNLEIVQVKVATTSGTPGGPILWNWMNNQTISATPAGTYYTGLLSVSTTSVAKLFNNTATTGSTAGLPLGIAAAATAVASAGGTFTLTDPVEGTIIVQPGQMIALAATATGTTHIVNAEVVWAEYGI